MRQKSNSNENVPVGTMDLKVGRRLCLLLDLRGRRTKSEYLHLIRHLRQRFRYQKHDRFRLRVVRLGPVGGFLSGSISQRRCETRKQVDFCRWESQRRDHPTFDVTR